MSASPMARQVTENKSIPRRVIITDPRDLPADYSSTPGGTLYSTTPGGSKIVYEKSFLINLRNSPISKTPPTKWDIPEDLMRGSGNDKKARSPSAMKPPRNNHQKMRTTSLSASDDQDQFQMDM